MQVLMPQYFSYCNICTHAWEKSSKTHACHDFRNVSPSSKHRCAFSVKPKYLQIEFLKTFWDTKPHIVGDTCVMNHHTRKHLTAIFTDWISCYIGVQRFDADMKKLCAGMPQKCNFHKTFISVMIISRHKLRLHRSLLPGCMASFWCNKRSSWTTNPLLRSHRPKTRWESAGG